MFSFKKAAAGVLSCTMLLGSLVISGCSDSNTSGTQSADNTSNGSSTAHQGEIKDISSVELVKDMKIGWSLGNTLDAGNAPEKSYTCYLFDKGVDKICKKVGEEAAETIIAAKNADNDELKNEINDLLYHVMVLCADRGLEWSEVEEVLSERNEKIGNLKQFHTTDKLS